MLSKKEQLSAEWIPRKYRESLINVFYLLNKLELFTFKYLKSGQVIHFCKRNLRRSKKNE